MALVGEERAGWPKGGGGGAGLSGADNIGGDGGGDGGSIGGSAHVRMVETPGGWLVVVVMVEAPGG